MTIPHRKNTKQSQPSHGEFALFATTLTIAATTRTPINHRRKVFARILAAV
jgi:hypothetical protein